MKKWIAFVLALSMVCSFVSCGKEEPEDTFSYNTTVSETTSATEEQGKDKETTATSSWRYRKIDLSQNTYEAKHWQAELSAKEMGYAENTYEFDYMKALSGISFYGAMANSLLNFMDFDASAFDAGYYETVKKMEYAAPYEEILYQTYSLLQDRNCKAYPITGEEEGEYRDTLPYVYSVSEIWDLKALSFSDIDAKLIAYMTELKNLPDKYPSYRGEWTVSDETKKLCDAGIAACQAVETKRDVLWDSWEKYYTENDPKLTVTEEIDRERHTVKITLSSDAAILLVGTPGEWIENFRYQMLPSHNGKTAMMALPMQSPVTVYIPISKYISGDFCDWKVQKIREDETVFYETVHLQIRAEDGYGSDTIQMKEPYLHAALTDFFGGAYSERDLLSVSFIRMDYWHKNKSGERLPNQILISTTDKNREYAYTDFFDISTMPDYLPDHVKQDMLHFQGLESLDLFDVSPRPPVYLQELRDALYPQIVTENTWNPNK